MLLVLGQGGTRLAVVLRLRLWSSTFAFPSGKGSGQLGALFLASWLFTGHERNMMQLPSKVYPVALLDRERSAALPNWPALNSPCGYTQLPIRDSESAASPRAHPRRIWSTIVRNWSSTCCTISSRFG